MVGGIASTATSLTVKNSYTKASITGSPSGAVVGNNGIATASVICSGYIAGWASGDLNATGNAITSSNTYVGTGVTISSKAAEFGWDTAIWDLSGNDPKLR